MASAVLPLKESSRELIVEVLRAVEPYFPDVTARWREQLIAEFSYDQIVLSKLERLTPATACSYFCHGDFPGFFENLHYYGARLAKMNVDTRQVARALELYEVATAPYLASLFSERQQEAAAVLEMISSAAFVTVSGAYFDTQKNESDALLAILDAELASGDLQSMLQKVLRICTSTFVGSFGMILLRDFDADILRVWAAHGLEDDHDDYEIAIGQGFAGRIAQTGEPELVMDAGRDARILSPEVRSKAKSLWGVPLNSERRVIGVLLIAFDKPYEWLPTERELLRAIADRLGLAIQRARMNEALREREARIAELSGHLMQAQEEERKRISRELHDETGQALMVIRLYLGMLEGTLAQRAAKQKVRETLEVVDRTIDGIRRIIGRLSPLVLQELGLVAAIRKEAKDLAKNTGVKARVAIADEVGRLAPETETAIYRVVQEALHNVAKHAHAKSVNIQMARENGTVRLLVEDDGVGLPPRGGFRAHSFGLAGIRERVGMLHGTVKVSSARGRGTRIEVSVPASPNGTPGPSRLGPYASHDSGTATQSAEGGTNAKD